MMSLKLAGKEKDLGGFSVRRLLPQIASRAVGPFVFFDHMGPASFGEAHGMDVRPHPHIGLATVTYLFEGQIEHRDSLGNDCLIEPGAINWMVAGKGIVHSERTPPAARASGSGLHGIQLWVALPEANEEDAPSFTHFAAESLPNVKANGVQGRLLLGRGFGATSPVPVHSPLVYAEFKLRRGERLPLSGQAPELAVYIVNGEARLGEESLSPFEMAIFRDGTAPELEALTYAHVVVLGGEPVGPRLIEWNFVSRRAERLAEAKRLWADGPHADNPRFTPVVGDTDEFIPLK